MTADVFEYEGYLVDLDGTLVSGGRALPGAAWLVDAMRDRVAIVSNDAEHTPDTLSHMLAARGLNIPAERIVLAGTTALDLVARDMPGAEVQLLASQALADHARRRGLRPVAQGGDIVLVGRDRDFSYDKLAEAARAVTAGAPLWLACPDTSHRGMRGEPVPETGALGAAIEAVAGMRAHRIVGKPHPALFEKACEGLGVSARHVLMIGDNPATDGLGAASLGMDFIEVRPGDLGPHLLAKAAERA